MAKKTAKAGTKKPAIEQRVQHLETVLHDFLTAHGETYNGAGEHLAQLREHLGKSGDEK